MDDNTLVQISDFHSFQKTVRHLGIEAIAGQENGSPVLTVTVKRILFVALIHNQCLKLIYRLHEEDFPGGVAFSNSWNATNFIGTLVPMTDGFVMKYEALISCGIVSGNLRDTLTIFAASVDKFQDEWFRITTSKDSL